MRSSIMIEGASSSVMKEIIQENLEELDAGIIPKSDNFTYSFNI